jgi:hypothetical protein
MKYRNSQYHGNNISFVDMLFNIIIVFALLFFIAVLLMNPPTKKKDIEAKADLIITMTWSDNSPHDIDLWVHPPEGHNIGYTSKENSYIFLDRDDLGVINNYIVKDDTKQLLPTRREVISFRGKQPGRYIVNAQLFAAKDENGEALSEYNGLAIPIVVELIQINPVYKILSRKELVLSDFKEEKTAFSFIIVGETITQIDTETKQLFITRQLGTE